MLDPQGLGGYVCVPRSKNTTGVSILGEKLESMPFMVVLIIFYGVGLFMFLLPPIPRRPNVVIRSRARYDIRSLVRRVTTGA